MPFSYSGNPKHSPLDKVRYLIGDTNSSEYFLDDDEILYEIDNSVNDFYAASACALAISAKLSRNVENRFEDIINKPNQAISAFRILSQELNRRGKQKVGMGVPAAGGIRRSEVNAAVADGDRVSPTFKRSQFSQDQDDRA